MALFVVVLKPTLISLSLIAIRVLKDKYTGQYTGAGMNDDSKVSRKDIAIYIYHIAYQLYDLVSDYIVW